MGQIDLEAIRRAIRQMQAIYGGKVKIEEWQDQEGDHCLKVVMTWKETKVNQILS